MVAESKAPQNEFWNRFTHNRQFVGEFIADPEAAREKYGLVMSEKDYLAIAKVADKLFEHASETLQNAIAKANACANHCQDGCTHQN